MQLQNKTVLVTGADGFIGSHLVEMLVQKGTHVKALAYYNSFNSWGWLEESCCQKEIEILTGDVRDSHFCDYMMKNVDIVFNLAALIAIPYSYKAPMSYIDTNIKGTLNVCQAALNNNVKKVVQISTSEVYGTAKYVPINEDHPLQPQSPYSASKIGADAIAMSFFNSFNLPVLIARPFNTYGPRQSARAIIPTIITQIIEGEKQIQLGDVTPTRDFNYVLDTCKGMILLSECDTAVGTTVNIGSGTEISIHELFNLIKKLMNSDARLAVDSQRLRPPTSEVKRLWCDITKIKKLTGYEPDIRLEEGLKKTITWFKDPEHLKKYKAGIYNV